MSSHEKCHTHGTPTPTSHTHTLKFILSDQLLLNTKYDSNSSKI